jgi:hypothetical protein
MTFVTRAKTPGSATRVLPSSNIAKITRKRGRD